jgi:hypothetical protein
MDDREKHLQIDKLYIDVSGNEYLLKFMDLESDRLLDEKIEVLTQLKEGKTIEEIPNFYDILENYPQDNIDGDKVTRTLWD